MKPLTVGVLKSRFSEVLKEVQSGEEMAVAFDKKREIVAYLVPKPNRKTKSGKLGILQGKITFAEDFKMTEEEFLGL